MRGDLPTRSWCEAMSRSAGGRFPPKPGAALAALPLYLQQIQGGATWLRCDLPTRPCCKAISRSPRGRSPSPPRAAPALFPLYLQLTTEHAAPWRGSLLAAHRSRAQRAHWCPGTRTLQGSAGCIPAVFPADAARLDVPRPDSAGHTPLAAELHRGANGNDFGVE
jgi:hypothetical protein